MKDIMDGGMNIMTAIIDSPTLQIMYIGLMLLYSIYVIREKRIVLSAQKHFTIYFPMNYLEYQIAQIRATELHQIIYIRIFLKDSVDYEYTRNQPSHF